MHYKGALPKTLERFRSILIDYSDERGSQNGIWAYFIPGIKSGGDPLGCVHQEHENTPSELANALVYVRPCDCEDCRRQPGYPVYPRTLQEIRRLIRKRKPGDNT